MLSKPKKIMMGFISALLSLMVLTSTFFIASANDLTEADTGSNSGSLSNEESVSPSFSDQDIINDVLSLIDFVVKPEKVVDWGAKKFVSTALGLKSKSEKENEKIMKKLDELMEGQSKLQKSMSDLQQQVTCSQLNEFLNDFTKLTSKNSTEKIYNTLRGIDEEEEAGTCSSQEAHDRRIQCLTTDLRLTDDTITSADIDIDQYTSKLASALLDTMKVTYEGSKTLNNDLFEINYQSLRRTYNWENQAYDEWIAFQNNALGTYSIAVTVDRLSLLARVERINKYNETHSDKKYTDSIKNQLADLDKDVKKIKELIDRKVVKRDDSERYYWVPGHEILFYKTPNTKDIPQENKNAGVGNSKALKNAKGLKVIKNQSQNYTTTVKYDFWKPFIRYEGGASPLVNYDQLNMILKDYDDGKSLYDIFFSKTEGDFKLPDKVDKNCIFVIDGQKSEVTGNSYPLSFKPYFFKADQAYCYGVANSGIKKGKLPSPSKIHLCYYHRISADPKTGKNCVGIGVKSVGESRLASNSQVTSKEETHTDYDETIVWSKNMDDIQLPFSDDIGDLISVSADDNIITEDKYSISDDKTQITLNKEFLLTLEDGEHTLVVESSDAISRFSFTVNNKTTPSESGEQKKSGKTDAENIPTGPNKSTPDETNNSTKTDIDSVQTGDSHSWKFWICLFAFSGLTLIVTFKKHKKIK